LNRHIIHIHIPAFAIAVARVCQPELRNRPVVVASPQSERAPILSVSSEARKEGLFKGMPVAGATKRCPGLTVLPPNPLLTERAGRALIQVAARHTPIWEPLRPGHLYLDVTGTNRLWGKAKDTAGHIGREIKTRFRLPATVGVAANKMVSNIASRVLPSEGVLDVDRGREAPFMAPLKVGYVPGIGRFRRKILLEELNIIRIRELSILDMGRMKLIFGRQALLIHDRALGMDPTPVYPVPAKPMVAEEATLPEDENDDQRLLGVLYRLVEKCSLRLRKRALFPKRAGLLIRYSDQMEVKRQIKLPHLSFWDFDLYGPLENLFFKACQRRIRVRYMRVRFWAFSYDSGQLSLFHAPAPVREKQTRVIQALDRIRERHGDDAIRHGNAA